MKKLAKIFLLFLFVGISSQSCKKIDELLTFTVNDTSEVVIESTLFPITLPFEIWTPPITTNSNEEFANNNTKASLVKDVYITHLDIAIVSPSDKTFSFLKSMTIFISTNDNDEIELARKENISSNDKVLNMSVTSSRLDSYIKASTYNLRTEVTTHETLTEDITLEIDMSFKVTADPL